MDTLLWLVFYLTTIWVLTLPGMLAIWIKDRDKSHIETWLMLPAMPLIAIAFPVVRLWCRLGKKAINLSERLMKQGVTF